MPQQRTCDEGKLFVMPNFRYRLITAFFTKVPVWMRLTLESKRKRSLACGPRPCDCAATAGGQSRCEFVPRLRRTKDSARHLDAARTHPSDKRNLTPLAPDLVVMAVVITLPMRSQPVTAAMRGTIPVSAYPDIVAWGPVPVAANPDEFGAGTVAFNDYLPSRRRRGIIEVNTYCDIGASGGVREAPERKKALQGPGCRERRSEEAVRISGYRFHRVHGPAKSFPVPPKQGG